MPSRDFWVSSYSSESGCRALVVHFIHLLYSLILFAEKQRKKTKLYIQFIKCAHSTRTRKS